MFFRLFPYGVQNVYKVQATSQWDNITLPWSDYGSQLNTIHCSFCRDCFYTSSQDLTTMILLTIILATRSTCSSRVEPCNESCMNGMEWLLRYRYPWHEILRSDVSLASNFLFSPGKEEIKEKVKSQNPLNQTKSMVSSVFFSQFQNPK